MDFGKQVAECIIQRLLQCSLCLENQRKPCVSKVRVLAKKEEALSSKAEEEYGRTMRTSPTTTEQAGWAVGGAAASPVGSIPANSVYKSERGWFAVNSSQGIYVLCSKKFQMDDSCSSLFGPRERRFYSSSSFL